MGPSPVRLTRLQGTSALTLHGRATQWELALTLAATARSTHPGRMHGLLTRPDEASTWLPPTQGRTRSKTSSSGSLSLNPILVPHPHTWLTCELALLQEALQEGRVREEHLLESLSTHMKDRVDEEAAGEVREQRGQISWTQKGRGEAPGIPLLDTCSGGSLF